MTRLHLLLALLGIAICLFPFRAKIRPLLMKGGQTAQDRATVSSRVAQYGDAVHGRLGPRFREIGVAYPPKNVLLVGLKKERTLEVWVSNGGGDLRLLKTYAILGASGHLGPKLAEGDLQVPEGLYQIESLNPNSAYHLSLRVNYPNPFDKEKGAADGRTNLGCDIMIHGSSASIGCLAMGDEAAEDLFVLAAETGIERISVILSPVDFRRVGALVDAEHLPAWTPELYANIRKELLKVPVPYPSPN